MTLCCVCGRKLSKRQARYVTEQAYEDVDRKSGLQKFTKRTRPVCRAHEKQINEGTLPVLSES